MAYGEAPPRTSGAACRARPHEWQLAGEATMAKVISQQGTENREYVRRLLKEKQPEFSAALELAAELVGRELGSPETQRDFSACEVS